MVNFVQSYVSVVQSLTASNSFKELLEHCRKEIENLEKASVNDLDRIIAHLTAPTYSIGLLFALIAKNSVLSKLKNEDDFVKFLLYLQEITPTFNLDQLEIAPDAYITLYRNVAETLLAKNRPLYGINLIVNAILHLCHGSSTRITSLHASLFSLCLKAKRFDQALPFFAFDVSEFFIDGSNNTPPLVDVKGFVSFFYYAGMIYCALERYDEALLMFEHAICIPAMGVSAIVVESLKKYTLLNILTGRKSMHLPGYKSPTIQRNIVPMCAMYFKLANIYKAARTRRPTELTSIVMNFVDQKKTLFEKDNNIGIIMQILNCANEDLMKRLPNAFISLKLSEVVRRANTKTLPETERLLRSLIYRQEFSAKINKHNKIVYFDVPETTFDPASINNAMKDLVELSELIGKFDEAVRLNSVYLAKSGKSGSGPFHEDEGFQMANTFQSPASASVAPFMP